MAGDSAPGVAHAQKPKERWSSRIGVILAVAGAAIGLGNFLRFPGKAAAYGGGAFLIPYFVSLVVLGIPIAWAEWTIGRYGGVRGFNSAPGVMQAVWRKPASKYFGGLALLVPLVIYMYYVYIEGWCLAYAWFYIDGTFPLAADGGAERYSHFFNGFVGATEDGSALHSSVLVYLVLGVLANLYLVYRGVSKGIETFCKIAVPVLFVVGFAVLARVLTLGTPDPSMPDRNVIDGLGFMWNPRPVEPGGSTFSALLNPQVWLEAAAQIFFTLGVGFGIIISYASYLRKNDDVVLSSLTSCAMNELAEVCLGGLITLPAAFVFLGAAPLAHVLGSTLGLGFHTFPLIFELMPLGSVFGFLFFFLLFLAAITSSIAMIQPVVAFLEEAFSLSRAKAVAPVALISVLGTALVVWFSRDLVALDTMDFWMGSVGIFILATTIVITFGWAFPLNDMLAEANRGAAFPIPPLVGFVLKWVCPAYLLAVLVTWLWQNGPHYASLLTERPAAMLTALFMLAVGALIVALIRISRAKWHVQVEEKAE